MNFDDDDFYDLYQVPPDMKQAEEEETVSLIEDEWARKNLHCTCPYKTLEEIKTDFSNKKLSEEKAWFWVNRFFLPIPGETSDLVESLARG